MLHVSGFGAAYFVITAVLGVVGGTLLVRYTRKPGPRAVWLTAASLGLTALVVHGLCVWVLFIDPTRATGTIPLPRGARLAAEIGISVLIFPGYFVQGFLLPVAVSSWNHSRRVLTAAIAVAALYSGWSMPWFMVVLFD